MLMNSSAQWSRYQNFLSAVPAAGLKLDISRMNFDEAWLAVMEPAMQQALAGMDQLEGGAIANQNENRMAGHYWLRTPALAPAPEIRAEI